MIITRTPFRVSFFGGGTDYPRWFREHGGRVLATAIDKYCYISLRHLPPFFEHKYRVVYSRIENVNHYEEVEHPSVRAVLGHVKCRQGVEIHHDGDLPARSGLGSSSSFTVGLLNALYALRGEYRSAHQLACDSIHIEQNVIGEHVGSQDQIMAAIGGFNRIEFFRDGSFEVEPVVISNDRLEQLQSHLLMVYTGVSRLSVEVAKSKMENFHKRRDELYGLGEMVDEAISILRDSKRDIREFGELLDKAWQYKRKLSEKVTNTQIDVIYQTGRENGAIGGKVLGAGGGGFVLLFVPPEKREAVKSALSEYIQVPFRFERSGSKVVLYQPDGL